MTIRPFAAARTAEGRGMLLVALFLLASVFLPTLLLFLSLKALPLFLNGVESAPDTALALLEAYRAWYALMLLGAGLGFVILIAFGALAILLYLKKDIAAGLTTAGSICVIMLMYGFLIFAFLGSEDIFTLYRQADADIRQIKSGVMEQETLTVLAQGAPYVFYGPYSADTPALLETWTFGHIDGPEQQVLFLPLALHFSDTHAQSDGAKTQYRVCYTSEYKIVTEITAVS